MAAILLIIEGLITIWVVAYMKESRSSIYTCKTMQIFLRNWQKFPQFWSLKLPVFTFLPKQKKFVLAKLLENFSFYYCYFWTENKKEKRRINFFPEIQIFHYEEYDPQKPSLFDNLQIKVILLIWLLSPKPFYHEKKTFNYHSSISLGLT